MTMLRSSNILLTLILLCSCFAPANAAGNQAGDRQISMITLAGESIEITLPFEVSGFIEAAPDDAVQIATAVQWNPFFEISLSAEPVRSALLSEDQRALAAGRLDALQTLRGEQAAIPQPAYEIDFLGQRRKGVSNQVLIHLRPARKEPVVIHEWVALSGEFMWTFRVSYAPGQGLDQSMFGQIVIRSTGPAQQESDLTAVSLPLEVASSQVVLASDLPTPAWWDGECDTVNYQKSAGIPAYPLGGVYRGIKACGPRPWYDGAPDVLVRFFAGAWGEFEWQCVELSMRYLYLAYAIPPYPGNGKDVVSNYPGARLIKVSNGSWRAPKPGDVLSYGPTTPYGHTSVVSAANIDLNGNGTITVIEQNSSASGAKTLTVANWYVQSSMTVSGWLHDPTGDPTLPGRLYLPMILTVN